MANNCFYRWNMYPVKMVPAKNPIQATRTTFEVVEALKEYDGAGVTELARDLGLSKSSVHNYLATLAEGGYVVQEGSEYHVGARFLDLGGFARRRYPIYETAKPEIDRLAEETGEMASLMIEEHGMGIYLYREKGAQAVNVDARTGHRVHLHNTALGKALLAWTPDERVEEIFEQRELPATTENTITERETLLEELDRTRERGYALDREERLSGIRCVAVPLVDMDERAIGAISVAGPTSRMQDETFHEDIPNRLQSAANIIELNVTYA